MRYSGLSCPRSPSIKSFIFPCSIIRNIVVYSSSSYTQQRLLLKAIRNKVSPKHQTKLLILLINLLIQPIFRDSVFFLLAHQRPGVDIELDSIQLADSSHINTVARPCHPPASDSPLDSHQVLPSVHQVNTGNPNVFSKTAQALLSLSPYNCTPPRQPTMEPRPLRHHPLQPLFSSPLFPSTPYQSQPTAPPLPFSSKSLKPPSPSS